MIERGQVCPDLPLLSLNWGVSDSPGRGTTRLPRLQFGYWCPNACTNFPRDLSLSCPILLPPTVSSVKYPHPTHPQGPSGDLLVNSTLGLLPKSVRFSLPFLRHRSWLWRLRPLSPYTSPLLLFPVTSPSSPSTPKDPPR